MKTTPEALKALYQTLGGSSVNVAGESKTTGILNKIAALFGSTATAEKIPDAIGNLNAVASGITKPAGKKSITTTAETDVADYATAQISDANLVAGNIKKDVPILGITGEYEGGGGSSEISMATVTVTSNTTIRNYLIGVFVGGQGIKEFRTQYPIVEGTNVLKVPMLAQTDPLPPFFTTCELSESLSALDEITVTGDIIEDGGVFEIYGDGTITFVIR